MIRNILKFSLIVILSSFSSCREDELVVPTEYDIIGDERHDSGIRGLYLVNEGNMGSNKCTIDYYDYMTGLYSRNFYSERNPNVIKELGDVGNDIGIYGSKLYVVVNCSHKVEVMDARTGVRINLSLKVTRKVSVGYQPEEMEIIDDYMYVANSGGYRVPNYDNTVSVIQMIDFKQIQQIEVGINLHRIKKDRYKKLWVSSRGDYQTRPSRLYVLEKKAGYNRMEVTDTIPVACSNMAIHGDSLFYYATEWNNFTATNTISYGIINVATKECISTNFITDGTEKEITIPYGIAVHPETCDIFVTDAKNYVSSGTLYCFTKEGKLKWKVRTGDIPAHITFLSK